MNVWLDITSEVFKGGQQMYIQMKAYVLPFKNIISFFNLGQFLHTLKSLRVHRTLLQVAGVLSGNKSTLPCEEIKIDMNVWFDITSEVFKGGQQMYIQVKAYVLPFKNIISFFNLGNSFIP